MPTAYETTTGYDITTGYDAGGSTSEAILVGFAFVDLTVQSLWTKSIQTVSVNNLETHSEQSTNFHRAYVRTLCPNLRPRDLFII